MPKENDERGQEEELEEEVEENQDPAAESGEQEDNDSPPGPIPYDRFKEVNERNSELRERLAALEREKEERDEKAEKQRREQMKEQERFQELAEEHESTIEQLRPELETARERVQTMEEILESYANSQMERVPEIFRPIVTKMPVVERLEWLTDNADKLKTTEPTGIPATPEGRGKGELTPEERRQRSVRTF